MNLYKERQEFQDEQTKLQDAIDEALEMFWEHIVSVYGEPPAGDVDFGAQTNLQRAAEIAVNDWLLNFKCCPHCGRSLTNDICKPTGDCGEDEPNHITLSLLRRWQEA